MKDPLAFLNSLKQPPFPSVVHLIGEESFIRRVVREKLFESWGSTEIDAPVDSLIGSEGALRWMPSAGGGGSLFSSARITWIADPPPGEGKKKGPNPLSTMGKNQIAQFVAAVQSVDPGSDRVLIETPGMKKTAQLVKALEGAAVQVDGSSPSGSARSKWIALIARKIQLTLAPELTERLEASSIPLEVVFKDLEKVQLAMEVGEEADVEIWKALTQAESEASIWEIGDRLGRADAGGALAALRALENQGEAIYSIVGALQTWSIQRIQVKAALEKGGAAPEGIHPFVFKKMREQVERTPMDRLRREQRALLHLDRALKQSWENPHVLLERLIVEMGTGSRTWTEPSAS